VQIFWDGESTYREGALAVAALEACLVVGDAVGGEEVDEVHSLIAGFALVLRPGERRHGDRPLSAKTPRPAQSSPGSYAAMPGVIASRFRHPRPRPAGWRRANERFRG
jgi:hypothetical protein